MTRTVTRSAVVETFLASLDSAKERGVYMLTAQSEVTTRSNGDEISASVGDHVCSFGTNACLPWCDSDERTEECGSCFDELPAEKMEQCARCSRYFCDSYGKGCFENHIARTKGQRWG